MSQQPLVPIIVPTSNRAPLLKDCLDSIKLSSYSNIEVIVVDDNSQDATQDLLKSYVDCVVVIKNETTQRLIKTRNLGARSANGKYLLFVDDDNIIDTNMVSNLVQAMEDNDQIGVSGPMMYYSSNRDLIWWSETKISPFSARTFFPHRNEPRSVISEDEKETEGIPNVFMVSRDVFNRLEGLDENYLNTWHEADFCERAKRLGFKVVCIKSAETYHQVDPRDWNGALSARSIGDNPAKAYTTIRNRYKFVGKYFSFFGKLTFVLIFSWLLLAYYIYSALKLDRKEYIRFYLRGALDGLKAILFV